MKKKLVELVNDGLSFAYGYLLYEDLKNIFINSLDDQGRFDGYILISKDLVDYGQGSDFLKKLKTYNEFWQASSIGKSSSDVFKNKPDDRNLINYAKDKKKIISLGKSLDYYDLIRGFVKDFDGNIVTIEALDINSGQVYDDFEIHISDIKFLEVESIDNILLKYVNSKNKL